MDPPTPLILVDVDGVLNPARPDAGGYRRHWVFPNGVAHRLLLNSSHGQMLTDLAEAADAELVWASYWQNKANTWIAPRIGLPPLRFFELAIHEPAFPEPVKGENTRQDSGNEAKPERKPPYDDAARAR